MREKSRAYERLARAYKNKTGVRFDADDVQELVCGDDAIETVVQSYIAEWEEAQQEAK
jgi:hypothetical protein